MGVPFADPLAAVAGERLRGESLGVMQVAEEEGWPVHGRRSGISGASNPGGRVGVDLAQEQPAGFVAVDGPQRLVPDRHGGARGKNDPLDPCGAALHGSSQVGQPGIGAVPGCHRIVSARVRSNGAAQPG